MSYNRVKQLTATAGAGTITLGAAESGFRTALAAAIPTGRTVHYVIEDGTAWEVGKGVYTTPGETLTRVLESSSTGALLNLSGASKVSLTVNASVLKKLIELNSSTILGRTAVGIGDVEELTVTQVTAMLDEATATIKGLLSAVNKKKLDAVGHSPEDHGAVGDGVTDDTAAVNAMFTAAATSGRPIDAGKKTFAVAGNITVNAIHNLWFKSLRLKEIGSSGVSKRTIHITNCNDLRIDHLEVDMGTIGSNGGLTTSAGIWIEGGVRHQYRHMRAYGSSRGSGIAVVGISKIYAAGLHAHNIVYDFATATDDVVQGIWFANCSDFAVIGPIANDLTGNANVSFPTRYTRGLVFSGCDRFTVTGPNIFAVDQGIDITGSAGNRNFTIIGGSTKNCSIYGLKMANSAIYGRVIGHIADGAGIQCFAISGPAASGLTYKTSYIDLIGCLALNAGYNNINIGTEAGYRIAQSAFDTTFPNNIRLIDCMSRDEQTTATMTYGAQNDVTHDAANPNELINFKSSRHVTDVQLGFDASTIKEALASTVTGRAVLTAANAAAARATIGAIANSDNVTWTGVHNFARDLNGETGISIQNRNTTGTPAAVLYFLSGALDLIDNRLAKIRSEGTTSSKSLIFSLSNGGVPADRYFMEANGDLHGLPAGVAPTMTAGFIHVPADAGAPTGVPTLYTKHAPLYYNQSNNQLYAYNTSWLPVFVLADKAVTLAKIQDINTAVILGRTTAAVGVTEQLTGAQVTAMLAVVVAGGAQGVMTGADKTKLDGIATGAQPGTVTAVSVASANGITGTSSGGTTPALTITLGAITPSSVITAGVIRTTGASPIGYNTGAGGTVTQLTNKATGVTINKACGVIVTSNASLAANTNVAFVVTNSSIAAQDTIILSLQSGAAAASYLLSSEGVSAGSFRIFIRNTTAGALAEALTINFAVIKGINA